MDAGAIRGRGYWQAGPDALIRAVAAVAERHGVTVRTGAEVARISVQDDAVVGVVLEGGEEIAARTVLSGADPAQTLLGMVDPVWLDPEFLLAVRNVKFRGNAARVLYAGADGRLYRQKGQIVARRWRASTTIHEVTRKSAMQRSRNSWVQIG